MATEVADDLTGVDQPKAAVLLIVGEPFSDGDKQLILEEIVNGFKGWDCEATGVDINNELAQIANRADLGEEGPNGERIIRHRSDNTAVELLINPQSQTVKDSLKTILTVLSPVKAVIYAGYAFQGTAAWVVQDDLFFFSTFNQIFKDSNVENALKQIEGASLMLYTMSQNDWVTALKGSDAERLINVSVNPRPKLDNVNGLVQFTAYVGNIIRSVPLGAMLQASDVVGNISFTRPVLYIFPGHHGDAALFGMKGFNMLVNGGYSRHSCFWDFVRHLDGIDALLMTHLGPDNLFGIKALLERKAIDTIHPDIDYMYMNTGKAGNGVKPADDDHDSANLIINLASEGNRLLELSRKLGHSPQPLTRPLSGNLEPINLFHKIGKGSLDMYILNPVGDAKEMKDFLTQWGKHSSSFGQSNGIPIPNCTSICALLVVRPASPTEKVTRILFPGTAPQHKLLEGLERVKHLEFLKHATFCTQDLQKPKKAASAPAGGRTGSAASKAPVASAPRSTPSSKPEPPKRLETKASATKASTAPAASAKSAKLQKDTNNKRASSAKTKEKVKLDEKEKEKSSSSSSPSKASVKSASPVKTPSSPIKTPATASPSSLPETASSLAAQSQPLVPEPASAELSSPEPNHLDQDVLSSDPMLAPVHPEPTPAVDNRLADTSGHQQLDNSADFGQTQFASSAMTEKERLRELGIYDNDDDEGVDDGFDDKENGRMFGVQGSDDFNDEIQPQSLPEPPVTMETAPIAEPDLIQGTFSKPSPMEQSQLFEQEIEPDYGADTHDKSLVDQSEAQTHGEAKEDQTIKEQSPVHETGEDVKEANPALEEPSFVDDTEVSETSNTIAQNIQYGMKSDNGFQMGGIREEEEEEAAAEREEMENSNQGQSGSVNEIDKKSMEEMGIYDDEEEEEVADAGGAGDVKDAYAYENDVNLEDEEIRMAGGGNPSFGEYDDQHSSNIPEAFERDESPTPQEKKVPVDKDEAAEVDSGQEDTDSIDGGTPDNDKDIDETFAMHQHGYVAQNEGEDLMAGQETGAGEGHNMNPFIGLGEQNAAMNLPANAQDGNGSFDEDELECPGQRGGPAEFDPETQWGSPTGLPAPSLKQSDELSEGENGFGTLDAATVDEPVMGPKDNAVDSESVNEFDTAEFDPLSEWGQPMGLPSPPPPEASSKGATKGGAGDTKKPDPKKPVASSLKSKTPTEKRPTSATKPARPTNGTAEPPKSARSKPEPKKINLDSSRSARPASGKSLDSSRVESKPRTTAAAARKPASAAKARASPDVIKMPPLPAFTPFYVDLTYIPNHGDLSYVDGEFFKRIRARYYVLSARNPNPKVLEMLIDAKATWDKANDHEVTVIPTYETQILQHWMAVHKEKLAENKIDIAPAASRCTVRLQDHEDSCYTYRLEF